MRNISVMFITGVMLLLTACGGSSSETSGDDHSTPDLSDAKNIEFQGEVPEALGQQMNTLLQSYLDIESALVTGDSVQVKKLGRTFAGNAALVDTALIKAEDKARWLNRRKQLVSYGVTLETTDRLSDQRTYFMRISSIMYEVMTDIGTTNRVLYRHYCPMAFDHTGAYWISEQADIRNPYFGNAMLTCGKVEEIITFK